MPIETIANQIWETYDSNKDGQINQEESKNFYEELITKRPDLGLTSANHGEWFGKIDTNNDGSISKEEMIQYLTSINYQG